MDIRSMVQKIKLVRNRMLAYILTALCLPISPSSLLSYAQDTRPQCALVKTGNITAKVTEVIDFQTVKTGKGHILRLSGIYIPPSSGAYSTARKTKREAGHHWQAKQFLDSFLLGKTVFYSIDRPTNRYGFHVVIIFLPANVVGQNTSLQEIMIRKGMAVFYALSHAVPCRNTLFLQSNRPGQKNQGYGSSIQTWYSTPPRPKISTGKPKTFIPLREKLMLLARHGAPSI